MTVGLSRRDVLAGARGLLVGAASSGEADAAEHDHGASPAHARLAEAALGCIKDGEACLQHCLQAFQGGDTTLARCAARVQDMLPVCAAMVRLATSRSERAAAYAEICATICRDCEAECRKHEAEHPACKACGDACARVIAACDALAA